MDVKGIRYLLFLLIIFIVPNVFAQSINSDSYSQKDSFNIASRYDFTTSNTLGDDMSLLSVGTIGTRYNGKSYYFQFNFHKSLTANKIYELKVSSTTSDFTSNINKDDIVPLCYSSFAYNFNTKECGDISVISVIRGSGNQSKDFTIRFSPLQAMTYWGFKFGGGFNALTGVSNFLVNNFDLTEVTADNTDEIINNNNQNTQNIIDNQNQNTQAIIDTLSSCYTNLFNGNNYVSSNFTTTNTSTSSVSTTSSVAWKTVSYSFNVERGAVYTLYFTTNSTGAVFYRNSSGGSWISVSSGVFTTFTADTSPLEIKLQNATLGTGSYTWSNLMLVKGSVNQFVPYGSDSCTNKIDNATNSINDVNNSLNNSNIDNGTGSDFFSNFTTSDNGGISAIVSKPLTIINNLLSNNGQCTNLTLPSFMGVSNATLPSGCILWNNATTLMITLWNTFICGLGSYFILKDIFRIIEDLKNPDNDRVEVMDL